MNNIFDSHAHYDDEQFDEDREELLIELKKSGVVGILNMSSDYKSIETTRILTETYPFIYGACGIHPENADEYNESVKAEMIELLKGERFRAVGEIGLDYYWESNPPKEIQKKVMRDQMEIAKTLGMPVILHDRDAHGDILQIVREFPEVTGVFHSFSGSVEMAREAVALGYYLGISGVATFKNARKLPEVIKEIPLDRLLLETDAPYMAPVPYRGKRNRSDYLIHVAEKIAELKGNNVEEVLEATADNARRLLGI
ncbi:TatD family hydrolase [Youngiibacter multivorans]|uniref:TatD DNase family protein n=1 Tax=Youngiibacter multivorans TaxID=937251 RepID=A0ABS4G2E1_9CLOT|nr:TatD family hydrolase [Youngiibacter multivorans]MBP1918717.1 TatD DNase family protein [Youngiibacter multivorans]